MASDRISTKILAGFIGPDDVVVENGLPIIIDGFIINNQNGYFGRYFKMTNTQGTTIVDFYMPAGSVIVYTNSFIADRGLVIKAGEPLMSYSIFYKGA